MKSKRHVMALLLSFVLILVVMPQQLTNNTTQQPAKNTTQPQQPKEQQKLANHTAIQLDKPYPQQLKKQKQFSQKYRITIPQSKVNQLKQQKWYLFVQVETGEQFQWQKNKIELFIISQNDNQKPIKQCDTQNGLDSCFLTSSNFDYKKDIIQAKVTCEEYCKFTISAELSTKYKLKPDESIQLNFQNTAYSKLFSLDTTTYENFRKLQIILKPTSFLQFNAPIRLYANKGESVPTKQKHDFAGIHLWDDGLGVFINYPDASNIFTILIQGPQKNILSLSTKIINSTKPVQTVRYEPNFAFLQSQQTQIFQISINKSQKTHIKLSTLTGSVQMSNIKDENMNNMQFDFTPLSRSYGQLEYKFQPVFFQKNKDFNITQHLYIQIKANKDSTFVFESYTNNDDMNYIAPEVNRYADLHMNATDMYYFKLVQIQENINQKNKQASVQIMTTTYGNAQLEHKFFLCKANQATQCQPTNQQIQKLNKNQSINNEQRIQLMNIVQDSSVSGVKYFEVAIKYEQFIKRQGVYHVYVIIVLSNFKQESTLYTLQYVNQGSTYFLKQKQLRRDRLSIDQIKFYNFINNDKDVKSVKIHSIEISGQIMMVGYKADPRTNPEQGKQIYEYHGSVTFLNVEPGQEFFLVVQGVDSAYYSLYLQLIRQSESQPDDKNNEGYNEIVIQENIPYDFFIKPKQKIIFQLHSTLSQFELFIGSHLPLELCMTQNLDSPPFTPNCEIVEQLTKSERLAIKMEKGLVGNMGVTNNNDKAVQFKVQMRVKTKQIKCVNAPLGILNTWSIQGSNQTNKQTACYKFNLNRRNNIELIVELDNMEYDNASITWQLNDKEKEVMMSARKLIWAKELVKVCGQSQLERCQLTVTIQSNYSTDVHAVVQYLDKDIILIDGMAQPSFSKLQGLAPKHFRYEMLNLVNTTIILENKHWNYHFFGKIISRKDFYASDRIKVYPTAQDNLFKSQNPFYFIYQVYLLTQEQIKRSNCTTECVLLISVQQQQNEQVSQQQSGMFTVEVSQQDRYLKQNQQIMGYLQGKSLAFYQYYNPKKGTIYVQISNQNMNCANIFIKKGNQSRATPSSYDKKSQNQNSLIFEDVQQGPYAITLQAKHFGCSYTILAMSSVVKVSRVKRGIFSDKTLQTNESVHFIYEHLRNQSFKIMTLNKIGYVMIKLKVLYEGQLNKLLATEQASLAEYVANMTYQDWNIDFLKVDQAKSLYFCVNCTYLISVTASKYTQTSLMIPSKGLQIPIATDAHIKDQVKQKQTTKFRIFTSNLAQYKVYVQYGKINLTIIESISNKVIISKVYEETKEPIYEKFNSSTSDQQQGYGYDFIHYSVVTIQGMANSSFYLFELIASEDEQKRGQDVRDGIPEYFYLQPKQTKCFKGKLDDESQEFILSFEDSTLQTVKSLSILCKVNDKQVKYTTNYGTSEMTLEINDLKITQPSPYEICLTSKQILSLTFIQSAHIIMVPSNTALLMTRPVNLTFGAKGTTLVQIDECQVRSVLSISSSFNDLHTAQSEIGQVRRGNNLIQFYFWGPVYVHLQTTGSRIRWRTKDTYLQQGMGYEKFIAGTALAYKQGQTIKIEVSPIQQVSKYNKNMKLQVSQVSYKIILAKNEKQLQSSLSCQQANDILKYEYKTQQMNKSTTATFMINQEMKSKFKKERYFLAGVIANLNIEVDGLVQSYRFIYPMVDIQREVLYGGEISKPVNDQSSQDGGSNTGGEASLEYETILLILMGAIFLVVVLALVYKKYVKKWIRYRRQKLSDQGSSSFKYTEFASMG